MPRGVSALSVGAVTMTHERTISPIHCFTMHSSRAERGAGALTTLRDRRMRRGWKFVARCSLFVVRARGLPLDAHPDELKWVCCGFFNLAAGNEGQLVQWRLRASVISMLGMYRWILPFGSTKPSD